MARDLGAERVVQAVVRARHVRRAVWMQFTDIIDGQIKVEEMLERVSAQSPGAR